MSTPTIQLAFQGGGAKLVGMLPIAHAFRQAERDGYISIRRASGTSAGAICASLIATRADFDAVRKYIVDRGPEHLATLVPGPVRTLQKRFREGGGIGFWDIVSQHRLIKRLLIDGEPLLRDKELKKFIANLLAAGNTNHPPQIENCPITLIVTASDVVSCGGIRHETGNLVQAIEDSCSLPILLRSFASLRQRHYVDGGLCDNLPVDCLLSDRQNPVFAVYPEPDREPRDNSNLLSYFISLLSASINHNVSRSIALVGNAFRFPARTVVDLLDFERAITLLDDDKLYKPSYDEAMERIISFSKSYGYALARSQARVVDSVDVDQFRTTLFNLTTPKPGQAAPFHCLRGQFIVRVNHERRITDTTPVRRTPDTVTRMTRLRVLSGDVRYYRATVNVSDDSIVPTIWSARNITTGKDVPIMALPLHLDHVSGVPMRHCLLEFIDHEAHFSIDDIIELQSTYASEDGADMAKLNRGQPDHFGFSNSTGMVIDDADVILVYPKSLGTMTLQIDGTRTRGVTATPKPLQLSTIGGLPLEITHSAVGLTVRALGNEASFSVLAVPT